MTTPTGPSGPGQRPPEHSPVHIAAEILSRLSPAIAPGNVPLQLKERPRWIVWRYGPPRSGGKRPKIPFNTRTGKPCDITDSSQWSDFETALAAFESYDGLGFVLNGDGIVGIDLDDCIADDGQITDWALEVV